MVEIESLEAGYGERRVLQNVDLKIGAGFTAILGPNGSGKTTLLKVISGILKPYKGRITVCGLDPSREKRNRVAKVVTLVSQDFFPVYDFSAIEIVEMAFTHRSVFPSEDERSIAMGALEYLGIVHLADRPFSTLSGGEKRLVMLARALAQGAKVVLVDELELHLDPPHREEMARVMRKLVDMGRMVIAVFHDIQLASSFADRFVGVRDGRIVFDTERLTTEELKTLYDSDFVEIDGVIVPWYHR